MNPFSLMPKEWAKVEKCSGKVAGPYQMIFTGEVIVVDDKNADIAEGDIISRKLPNGNFERFTVTKSTFYQKMRGMPAHFQFKFAKGTATEKVKPLQTINIQSAQAVQIGDQNTQQITATIHTLVQLIDESDASEVEKVDAKDLLQKFLEHPLVAAIVGAVIGLGK